MGWDIAWRFPEFGSKDQTIFAASLGGIRYETEILNKEVHGTVYEEKREREDDSYYIA